MSIVKRIKNLCIDKEITLAELERAVDISNGSIRRWDDSSPNLKNIEKVANYFNVSIDSLVGRDSKPINVDVDEETILIARNLKSLPKEQGDLIKNLIKSIS